VKYLILLLFISVLLSCTKDKADSKIYWVESNAICVHWTDFGKKNFETNAVRIVLKSKDSKVFESKRFDLSTEILEKGKIALERVEKLNQIDGEYLLYLFIRSENLYDEFPKGENYYNDDCYHIELANMIGQGEVVMQSKDGKSIIGKSKDYTLSVGPK